VVKGLVEAARHDVQADVGRAGIGRAQRVELLDRAVCVDHDQRARQQPEPLGLARMAKHELDQLAEQADSGLLLGRVVPAVEDADQPVRVSVARRRRVPVRMRQEQVQSRGRELEQRLVGADRVVVGVNRAQDAGVAVLVFGRAQQVEATADRFEAVAAIRVHAVPPGRLGVPVEADADLDLKPLEDGQHRRVEQGPVGLHRHVHPGGHSGAERADQPVQPLRARHQGLSAVQDDFDRVQLVPLRVLGNAIDGLIRNRLAHSLRQRSPALIGHFIDVAIGARQITAAVDLHDVLPEGNRTMPRFPGHRHV